MRRLAILFVLITICIASVADAEETRIVRAQLVEAIPLVGIDKVQQQYGLTGRGVGIYIFDYFDTTNPNDHGWFVKAIIEAIAPGASIWYCNMNARHAFGGSPNCIDALMEDRDVYRKVSLINTSVVSGKFESDGVYSCDIDAVLGNKQAQQVEDMLKEKLWVSAVGNVDSENSLLFPACLDSVLSVGATLDSGPNVDELANFSKRPPFMDVVAPGAPNVTPWPDKHFWGTSAATPVVTGISALMLEANPGLRPSQISNILRETGDPALDPITGVYYPRVNAYKAVQAIMGAPSLNRPGAPEIEISSSRLSANEISQGDELCVELDVFNHGTEASVPFEIVSERTSLLSVNKVVKAGRANQLSLCFNLSLLGLHTIEIRDYPSNQIVGNVSVLEKESRPSVIRLPSGSSNGAIQIFDGNHDGYLDDFEFFTAVDYWIDKQVTDDLFFTIIDAWIGRIRLQGIAESNALWSYQILNLRGRAIASGDCTTQVERMALLRLKHTQFANGTYVLKAINCETGQQRVSFMAIRN